MRRRDAVGALVASLIAGTAAAQGAKSSSAPTPCTLVGQPTTRFTADTLVTGGQVVFVGGGVLLKCPQRGITLRGDSAERYPDRDFLVGHVVYDELRFHLTSDFLTHFPADERIIAAGNVDATLPSGSRLVGPIAEYRRDVPRIRPRRQVLATSRPTITIVEKDSAGKPVPPMTVVANQVFMDGDSLVYAGGQVSITRPNLAANADSAFIDEGRETMRLMRNPSITGKKDRPFTLSGDLIDLFSRNQKLWRVVARANATAVSDSMTLKSDTIDLRVQNDELDHAYAWGDKSRARVVSPSQNLLADSLDVSMPGQRLRLVRAVRKAFADHKADTVRFRVEKADSIDWLRGDTIVAHFDSTAAADSSKTPGIQRLVALGNSSALYHLAPSDTAERRPAINYVTARQITIAFDSAHKVSTVTNVDSISGVFIEPRSDTTSRKAVPSASGKATDKRPGKTPAKAPPKSVVPLPPRKP